MPIVFVGRLVFHVQMHSFWTTKIHHSCCSTCFSSHCCEKHLLLGMLILWSHLPPYKSPLHSQNQISKSSYTSSHSQGMMCLYGVSLVVNTIVWHKAWWTQKSAEVCGVRQLVLLNLTFLFALLLRHWHHAETRRYSDRLVYFTIWSICHMRFGVWWCCAFGAS